MKEFCERFYELNLPSTQKIAQLTNQSLFMLKQQYILCTSTVFETRSFSVSEIIDYEEKGLLQISLDNVKRFSVH